MSISMRNINSFQPLSQTLKLQSPTPMDKTDNFIIKTLNDPNEKSNDKSNDKSNSSSLSKSYEFIQDKFEQSKLTHSADTKLIPVNTTSFFTQPFCTLTPCSQKGTKNPVSKASVQSISAQNSSPLDSFFTGEFFFEDSINPCPLSETSKKVSV